jgi:hypothetical protein
VTLANELAILEGVGGIVFREVPLPVDRSSQLWPVTGWQLQLAIKLDVG